MSQPTRDCVFISHATPEDNRFVSWLGAKLSGLGYEVWADIFRLRGGADWSRELEQALRTRAVKMLLVCTPSGLEKPGVRAEIEMATVLAKQLGDAQFIIPLRLEPYEPTFRIANFQYIDFTRSWAAGLGELSALLSELRVPTTGEAVPAQTWLEEHARGSTRLVPKTEPLMANWLKLRSSPKYIRFYDTPGGIPLDDFQSRAAHKWPVVPFRSGVLAFSAPHLRGAEAPVTYSIEAPGVETSEFISLGWPELGVRPDEAKRAITDLASQAFDAACQAKGLRGDVGANGRVSWWGDIKTAPLTRVSFDWGYRRGSRQIVGQSKGIHWHLGMQAQMRTWPVEHLRLRPRIVFTPNGMDPAEDKAQAHSLRRKVTKSWRNAKWRDMLCAYLWWFTGGKAELGLAVGEGQYLVFSVPPMQFSAPVRVASGFDAQEESESDNESDDQDAVGEEDRWEDEGHDEGAEE